MRSCTDTGFRIKSGMTIGGSPSSPAPSPSSQPSLHHPSPLSVIPSPLSVIPALSPSSQALSPSSQPSFRHPQPSLGHPGPLSVIPSPLSVIPTPLLSFRRRACPALRYGAGIQGPSVVRPSLSRARRQASRELVERLSAGLSEWAPRTGKESTQPSLQAAARPPSNSATPSMTWLTVTNLTA